MTVQHSKQLDQRQRRLRLPILVSRERIDTTAENLRSLALIERQLLANADDERRIEEVAARTGVKLVGPAMTWGTMTNYQDPVVWMDAFVAEYARLNNGRAPQIDYLVFHWYDYGLKDQFDRLKKYGKPFWITEMANWHSGAGPHIDTVEKQKVQMTGMVKLCEERIDVHRYAWFTGRWNNDVHFTSLLAANGELTELGRHYLSLPVALNAA